MAIHAQSAEQSQFSPSADDVGGNGIGDEEHADHEGDEGEGGEVELERTEHFFDFTAPAFRRAGPGMGGKLGSQPFEKLLAWSIDFSGGIGSEQDFDAVDLAAEGKRGLDGGDVRDGEVIIGAEKIGGGLEKKTDT